jgi:hypothetical protein
VSDLDERELRARVNLLQSELLTLSAQCARLFRSSGWILTSDEPPPIGLKVLGASHGLIGWYTKLNDWEWRHDYMNGRLVEGRHGPDLWMPMPALPETE